MDACDTFPSPECTSASKDLSAWNALKETETPWFDQVNTNDDDFEVNMSGKKVRIHLFKGYAVGLDPTVRNRT